MRFAAVYLLTLIYSLIQCISLVHAIYADQIGEVDFHLKLIGEPIKDCIIATGDDYIVATTRGLIACLDQKSGSIKWRQIVSINHPVDKVILAKSLIISLSNQATTIHAWDVSSGHLLWETHLPSSSSSSSSIVDLSFDPTSAAINIIAHNTLYFIDGAGKLIWSFSPHAVYQSSALTVAPLHAPPPPQLELHLLLLHLAHPPPPATQSDPSVYAAIACLYSPEASSSSSSSSPECVATAVLSVDHSSQSTNLLVFSGIPASPAATIRSNIMATSTTNGFADSDVIYSLSPNPSAAASLLIVHLSPKHSVPHISVFIPDSSNALSLSSFSLLAGLSYEQAYAGLSICTSTGCSSYVYFPRIDELDTSTRSLLAIHSCKGEGATTGSARLNSHDKVTGSISCAGVVPKDHRIELITSSIGSDRVIASHSQQLQISASISSPPIIKFISTYLPSSSLDSLVPSVLLLLSHGELVFANLGTVTSVREEALANTRHIVGVAAHVGEYTPSRTPSFADRLSQQRDKIVRMLAGVIDGVTFAATEITSASLPVVFAKLWHGDYRSHRGAKNVLFGFNKIAVCLTHADDFSDMKIIALDLLGKGAVMGAIVPVLPSHEKLTKAALISRDSTDRELMLVAASASGKVFVWNIRIASLVSHGGALKYLPLSDEISGSLLSILSVDKKSASGHNIYALVFDDYRVTLYPPVSLNDTKAFLHSFYIQQLPTEDNNGVFQTRSVDLSSCSLNSSTLIICSSSPLASALFPIESDKMLSIAYPTRGDMVSSRTNTLGDQSLLLKYINPHMMLIVSRSMDNSGVPSLLITIIDSASARVLYRGSQQHGDAPVHAVMVENHAVVVYWNAKAQRTELSSIALYEGMVGKYDLGPFASGNPFAGESEFSSFTTLAPLALQKTFILPRTVSALHRTITQTGLTNKNFLLGTTSGQIISMDLRAIHPRRPLADPTTVEKEEGLIKYMPYLIFASSAFVTHNTTVMGLKYIQSAPSNLESTSLVFGYGLDIFYNHNKPSQSFDLLASDFNKTFLVLLLTGLFIAVLTIKKMASRKILASLWL